MRTLPGNDVVAMARTGSGKTAAFLLPLLHRLRCHSPVSGARGLVLSPTRELALQTMRFGRDMAHFTDLRMCCLVGGDALDAQFEALAASPDLLVATPGRLLHHLSEVDGMSLRTVEVAVLDEADRLFEMGFAEQIRDIFRGLSEARQTLLFSATLPHQLADFAAAGLRSPAVVRLDAASTLPDALRLSFFAVRPGDKVAALLHVLRDVLRPGARALVFASTRHHVEMLASLLRADGVLCGAVYGAMDQTARRGAVARFRSGAAPVLVVTDVAARGIDIPLLDAAVNFDFPPTAKLFVHRVGRVARAGAAGDALSLVTREDMGYLVDLHLFLGRALHVAPSPGATAPTPDGERIAGDESNASLLGALPPVALEAACERVRVLTEDSDEVRALLRVSVNAFKQYCKTRPPASNESVRRGRELQQPGVHPMLLHAAADAAASGSAAGAAGAAVAVADDAALAAFASRLGRYRPAATVLEAQVAPMRPVSAARVGVNPLGEVMKAKRAAHGGAIAARASEARAVSNVHVAPTGRSAAPIAPLACGRFRDESFFLDATPKPAHFAERGLTVRGEAPGGGGGSSRALTDSVMDLVADDAEGAARARALVKWDARKRRYISLHGGDAEAAARRGNKKLRTESGTLIGGRNSGTEENATGLYKKWQAKTKLHVVRGAAPRCGFVRAHCVWDWVC
jgi:ATP-dependent RNA helicase DDX54/DBP10